MDRILNNLKKKPEIQKFKEVEINLENKPQIVVPKQTKIVMKQDNTFNVKAFLDKVKGEQQNTDLIRLKTAIDKIFSNEDVKTLNRRAVIEKLKSEEYGFSQEVINEHQLHINQHISDLVRPNTEKKELPQQEADEDEPIVQEQQEEKQQEQQEQIDFPDQPEEEDEVRPRLIPSREVQLEQEEVQLDTVVIPKPKAVRKPRKVANEDGTRKVIQKMTKERKQTLKNKKGISEISRKEFLEVGDIPNNQRYPLKKDTRVVLPSYYMNNRKFFITFINDLFHEYKLRLLDESQNITCDNLKNSDAFSLLTHQKIVRDYMSLYSPYRGILLYHGLGSGKTCSSIAIAEGLKDDRQILILTPASLRPNYIEELKKCGDIYYMKNQFWEWVSIEEYPELVDTLSASLNLNMEYIVKQSGAWLIDVSKPSNYETLLKPGQTEDDIEQNQLSLNFQLNEMINNKYQFINYNGLRSDSYEKLHRKEKGNPFNNKVVIIDEAHNLVSRIVNQINKMRNPGKRVNIRSKLSVSLSIRIYKDLLTAENARIVMLSGTPIINYPNEIGILFNILRGYINSYNFKLRSNRPINMDRLQNIFRSQNMLDYINFNANTNVFTVTRNPFGLNNSRQTKDKEHKTPFGFENAQLQNGQYQGVSYREIQQVDEKHFAAYISSVFESERVSDSDKINVLKHDVEHFNALPDTITEFTDNFIKSQQSNVYEFQNQMKFKKRIMGMTSYFRSAQEELLPRYDYPNDFHVIRIPMSDYQFNQYETYRQQERMKEQKVDLQALKVDINGVFIQPASTYKIFSRLACNFVVPGGIPPVVLSADEIDILEHDYQCELGEDCKEQDPEAIEEDMMTNDNTRLDTELEGDELLIKRDPTRKRMYETQINQLKNSPENYLGKESLKTLSPKFLAILENIQNPENIGLHLLYSQFRTFQGIGLFIGVLEANGFAQFKIRNNGETWVMDIKPADMRKPKFVLYTGMESSEEREIVRNIYNGSWKNVPKQLADSIRQTISETNEIGQIVKLIMITSAGSEGINLLNTRFVHIMEPYWHPVRTEQVIGRARRICSHQSLPIELQTVSVFLYLMQLTKEQYSSEIAIKGKLQQKDVSKLDPTKFVTTDESLFEISSIKESLSKQLLKAVKESSIDCAIHVKSSEKENLSCLSFNNFQHDDYSYNPNIVMDQDDVTARQNESVVLLSGLKGIVNRKNGVEKKYVLNKETNELYDYNSYLNAKVKNNIDELILVGRLNGKTVEIFEP